MNSPAPLRRSFAFLCAAALFFVSAASLLAQAPVFFPVVEVDGRTNVYLTYQTAAEPGPVTYSATGLPAGVVIDTASGLISGTPTGDGTFDATLSATSSSGTGTVALTFVIAPPLPFITVAPEVASGYPAQGVQASFLLTRTGDVSGELLVNVVLVGSAQNGVDYQQIKLVKKFKAGKATKRVRILAKDLSGQGIAKKTVKLNLQPASNPDQYNLGDAITAKVKVFYTP